MVLIQKLPFFQLLFLGNISQKNVLYDILELKKLLSKVKKTSSKSQKIEIFPKGLTHGFSPKMAIFPTFSFRQYTPGKCVLRYSRTKKRLCRL